MMSKVTLILPKDRSVLEDRYAEILAEVVSGMLTDEEREYLVCEIERRKANGTI